MAKLDRKDVKIFAENSKETLITEFRTEDSEGNTASFSRDPDVIQNENYSQGWVNDSNNLNTKIYGEDLNAVNYVLSYLLKYLYENGIAEWKSTTTYYQNSICKVDNALYLSLQNNNIGNDPTSTVSYWKLIPLENVSIEDAGSGFSIVKDVTDNVITFKTISVTGYGEITDNGDQLNIDITGGGGGGGGDTYWGMIRGTITNQTDLMALINLKQDIFTVDSPLVLTDEQHLTINKATSSVSGYLDSTDFVTFNGKQDTLSATLPISITSNNIEIATANTSTTGALSYTDWNTFNGKFDSNNTGIYFTKTTEQSVDTVLIRPNSSTQVTLLGTSAKPFTNLYANQINDSSHPTTEASVTEIKTDQVSGITTSTIVNTAADLVPTNTNTYNLGSSSNIFAEGYFNNTISNTVTTDNYKNNLNYTNPTTPFTNFNFGSTYYYDNGTNNEMSILNIKSYYDSDTNTITEILPQKTNVAKIHICNLGNSDYVFSEGWIKNLKTDQLAPATRSNLEVRTDLIPLNNSVYKIGTDANHKFASLWVTNINGSPYNPSDETRKENIQKRNNNDRKGSEKSSLNTITSLDTYTFNYKDDNDKTLHIGIMAQDLQKYIPECVVDKGTTDEKGEKESALYIDVFGYITILTEAIKELNEKVETLEARIEELEGNKEEELKK